jgi:hypothetical protein
MRCLRGFIAEFDGRTVIVSCSKAPMNTSTRLSADEGRDFLAAFARIGVDMQERITNILTLLTSETRKFEMMMRFSPQVIAGFTEVAHDGGLHKYKLETSLGALTDAEFRPAQTFLVFYEPEEGDTVFSVGIEHYFGFIAAGGLNESMTIGYLCQLLASNDPAFSLTGSFLSIKPPQGRTTYASVNCMLPFIDDLTDEQVAKTLAFQFSWIFKGLEALDDSIPILKRFSPEP